MLVLTRRIGQSIIINDDIRFIILNAKGNQVRIGIEAPKEVSVHRQEIYEIIKEEKEREKTDIADSIINKVKGLIS